MEYTTSPAQRPVLITQLMHKSMMHKVSDRDLEALVSAVQALVLAQLEANDIAENAARGTYSW